MVVFEEAVERETKVVRATNASAYFLDYETRYREELQRNRLLEEESMKLELRVHELEQVVTRLQLAAQYNKCENDDPAEQLELEKRHSGADKYSPRNNMRADPEA